MFTFTPCVGGGARRKFSGVGFGAVVFLVLILHFGCFHPQGGSWSYSSLVKADAEREFANAASFTENERASWIDPNVPIPTAAPQPSPPPSSHEGRLKAAADFLETMKLQNGDVEEVAQKAAAAIEEVERARNRQGRAHRDRRSRKHSHPPDHHENEADEEKELEKERFRKATMDALGRQAKGGEAGNRDSDNFRHSNTANGSSSSKLGKVASRACATYTKEYMHRFFNERLAAEKAYLDARAYFNEIQVNHTMASHAMSIGPTREEVEEARARADVKEMSLHMFDDATWSEFGKKIAPACLEEADNFRYFLLHHSVKEKDEAQEKAKMEEARKRPHLVRDDGVMQAANAALMEDDSPSFLENAQFMVDVVISTLFPPLYMLQQVVWAVGEYHISEYHKMLDPWVQKHLPWVLPTASPASSHHHHHRRRPLRRNRPMPPSSQLLTGSSSIEEEVDESNLNPSPSVLSTGLFTQLRHSLGKNGSEYIWVGFVVVGVLVASWCLLPVLLLTFFIRDVVYRVFICQFLLQDLLGFGKPIRFIAILKMIVINPLAAMQMVEDTIEPFLQRWDQRGERWMNVQTMMVVELLVIVLPLTIIAIVIAEKWVQLVLAMVW